jgi:MFS family permease
MPGLKSRRGSFRPDPARAQTAAPGVLASVRETGPAVRWLLGCMFVNQLGAFVLLFLVLYLVHEGIDEGRAGLALGAYGLGTVLGALVGGSLADRLGRRTTIVGAMLSAAALTITLSALASPQTYGALLVVVFAAGVATQASRPAAAAMLADLVPPERLVMSVSMSRLALNSGAVIAPLMAAALMTVSWNLLFFVDGLTAVACALLAWRFLPGGRPAATAPAGAVAGGEGDNGSPVADGGYRTLLRDGRFLLYLFAMLASAVIYMQYFAVLPLKLRADGHPGIVYSAVLALSAGVVISCELFVTKRVQVWRPVIAATGGCVLIAIGFAAYGLSGGLWLLFAATLVGVLGQIVGGPTMFAHPQRVAPLASRGRYTGAAHAMFGLGTALGPPLGVLLWEALGDGIWTLCGALGALAAIATFAAVHKPPLAALTPRFSSTPITGTSK